MRVQAKGPRRRTTAGRRAIAAGGVGGGGAATAGSGAAGAKSIGGGDGEAELKPESGDATSTYGRSTDVPRVARVTGAAFETTDDESDAFESSDDSRDWREGLPRV